jgi:hypothetical protein
MPPETNQQMLTYIAENLSIFLASAGGIFGAVLSTLWVVRYRIPSLEKRTAENSARIAALETSERTFRDLVRKHELYAADGRTVYVHREECLRQRDACMRDSGEDLSAIRASLTAISGRLDQMDRSRQDARTLQISFMAAVKQHMDLEFTVPEH